MICEHCGTQNLAGAKFCMECARPLTAGCANCGFVNPPAAKFCSECATPITTARVSAERPAPSLRSAPMPEPTAERRVVSVLFADLVGFTTLAKAGTPRMFERR